MEFTAIWQRCKAPFALLVRPKWKPNECFFVCFLSVNWAEWRRRQRLEQFGNSYIWFVQTSGVQLWSGLVRIVDIVCSIIIIIIVIILNVIAVAVIVVSIIVAVVIVIIFILQKHKQQQIIICYIHRYMISCSTSSCSPQKYVSPNEFEMSFRSIWLNSFSCSFNGFSLIWWFSGVIFNLFIFIFMKFCLFEQVQLSSRRWMYESERKRVT